jgi:hypothetical protein
MMEATNTSQKSKAKAVPLHAMAKLEGEVQLLLLLDLGTR